MNIKSRKVDLVTQDINGELFVYDLKADKVYSLNETSAFIWQNLDGETSISDLSFKTNDFFKQSADEELVWLAIDELRKHNLLEDEDLPKAMSKIKRREVIKRIGLASMIALPLVSSLIAPTAANAASGLAALCKPCNAPSDCAAPGTCKPLLGGGAKLCANNFGGSAYASNTVHYANNLATCTLNAQYYCCNGTATFSAPTNCTCN